MQHFSELNALLTVLPAKLVYDTNNANRIHRIVLKKQIKNVFSKIFTSYEKMFSYYYSVLYTLSI